MIKNYLVNNSHKHASKWLVLSIDVFITIFNFFLAYVVRFGITLNFDIVNLLYQLPIVAGLATLSFLLIGSYKGVVRHTGMRDAYNLFLAVTVLITLTGFLMAFSRMSLMPELLNIPVSIICIHYLLNIITLTTSRLVFKYCFYYVKSKLGETSKILIYGAGDSGLITQAAITNDSNRSLSVIGFIDDNPQKIGKTINGIKVYSSGSVNQNFVAKNNIKEIVVSIPHINKKRLSEISDNLLKLPVTVKIIPAVNDWIDGKLKVSQIKEIQIEDLLDRAPINMDNQNIKEELHGKVILITGAAGSIGSEIVRQASYYSYKHLVLVDQAESPLYDLQQELLSKGVVNFTPIVADIRDHQRIETIFEKYRPNMVFHAAAYKHVPLMENNPCEAIKINVLGTRKLADLSSEFGVDKFVFVSTDKAVNPTNVMGATKRVAEMYIKWLHRTNSKTKFITTRFGNVLGSNGSVIPLFKKQIQKGGPLTVTHQDVTRFFMTIPEASQLVIEAGTMGNGGEIFIFDMGESVKIFDLARKMIRLSGLKYPSDIDIKITGLRPGEKLYEELLADTENTLPTYHKKIMISKFDDDDCLMIKDKIDDLCIMNLLNQDHQIVGKLKEIVPEFISNNSTFESIDKINKESVHKKPRILV